MATSSFVRGKKYTRKQINAELGGGVQDYLPHVGGEVVCGAFSKDINPGAPNVILPGTGREIERWARVFAEQTQAIPVFIKIESNEWYCMGNFRCVSLEENPAIVARYADEAKRDDVTMVLHLERDRLLA